MRTCAGHITVALLMTAASLASAALAAPAPDPGAIAKATVKPPPSIGELPALLKQLTSKKSGVERKARNQIVLLLRGKDSRRAVVVLSFALADAKRPQKTAILRCLGACGRSKAVRVIVSQLDDDDKWVRLCALAAVRKYKIEEPEFLNEVRDLLDEDDRELRREAALVLGKFKDKESTDKLIDLMEGEDSGLRDNAAWAMEQITGKKLGKSVDRWRTWQETQDKLEERKEKREAAKTKVMRKTVKEESKPKEEPVDRTALHLTLSFSGLALLALLAAGVWVVMPTWLNARLGHAEERRAKGQGVNIAELAKKFRVSDHMPDFVVYPFLLSTLTNGSPAQKEIALRLLELRAFGGCRLLTDKSGSRGRGKPTKAARQWISSLPRSLLEDLATLRAPGRRLVLVLDPDNPRWKRAATADETHKAQRSYNSWLGKAA